MLKVIKQFNRGSNGQKIPVKLTTWLVVEVEDGAVVGGPDRNGESSMSFLTKADAVHAADWRVDNGISEGPVL